jgi:hypothetical protein
MDITSLMIGAVILLVGIVRDPDGASRPLGARCEVGAQAPAA